jgi:hypothetical protein
MRRLPIGSTRTLLAGLCALLLTLLVAAPAAACPARPSMHVKHVTNGIYQYDGSGDGSGPIFPATHVTAWVKNCPVGDYQMFADLVQGGVSMDWAVGGALGAGEVVCDGDRWTPIGMDFYGPTLHPGRALATFELHLWVCDAGICSLRDHPTAAATVKVWIPR